MPENDNVLPAGSVPLAQSLSVGATPVGEKPKISYMAAVPVDIGLPDGRKIGMAQPNMSLSEKVARVLQNLTYKDPVAMGTEQERVKSLMYITDIDGIPEPKIDDPMMRAALEEKIGLPFLDALFMKWMEHFPSVDKDVLTVTKKS